MYLHEDLRLKKVVFLDHIPENFSAAFDKCVRGLPKDAIDWPTIVTRMKSRVPSEIRDESTPVARCAHILRDPCSKIASGFQFKTGCSGTRSFLGRKNRLVQLKELKRLQMVFYTFFQSLWKTSPTRTKPKSNFFMTMGSATSPSGNSKTFTVVLKRSRNSPI
jgi:hypothetical protein